MLFTIFATSFDEPAIKELFCLYPVIGTSRSEVVPLDVVPPAFSIRKATGRIS
jgi:hypothetical protein